MTDALAGRTIFLEDVPLETARERFARSLEAAGVRGGAQERVALDEALGRVTAASVFARLSSPHYHACAMDGIAVAASRTRGARETAPVELRVGSEAVFVDTGDPLPAATDAVIPIEDVEMREAGRVAIRAAVAPFAHVRAIGEDIVATETVVAAGRTLEPADLAALAAAGVSEVSALITTGTELVPPDVEHPAPGAIVDSNAVLLRAAVRRYGGIARCHGPVPDDPAQLEAAVAHALETSDVVVVNAGSSAGSQDYTARVLARFGEVVVHGVAIRPAIRSSSAWRAAASARSPFSESPATRSAPRSAPTCSCARFSSAWGAATRRKSGRSKPCWRVNSSRRSASTNSCARSRRASASG